MSTAEPTATRLADYAPPPFLVDEVDLDFELDEERTVVRAKLAVRRNPDAPPDPAPTWSSTAKAWKHARCASTAFRFRGTASRSRPRR